MSSTTLPSAMRSLVHNQKSQSLIISSVPLPIPSPNEYLIKPHAVALTAGELLWPRPAEFIISVPGVDVVARVVSTPSASQSPKFKPGDEVFARMTFPRPGSAREYSLALEEELARRPRNMSIAEAASVPVSALTAWQAFYEHAGLAPPAAGDKTNASSNLRILITGASGGVGLWAVQLGKAMGATVIATCGPTNIDFVRGLGADEILDYTSTNIRQWAEADTSRKVDVVLDCVGRSSLEQAWHAVKEGGQVISIAPPADMIYKFVLDRPEGVSESISGKFFIMHPSGEQLGKIAELSEQGKVKAQVDSVFKLDEFEEAFARVGSGHARGKVILRIDDEE